MYLQCDENTKLANQIKEYFSEIKRARKRAIGQRELNLVAEESLKDAENK